MRIEIPTADIRDHFTDTLKERLKPFGLPFYEDSELLFWPHHFDGKSWATYSNGRVKGGTMRFREGLVRIPTANELPTYVTEERKAGLPPRAIVQIPGIVVCNAGEFTLEELASDGFFSHEDMMEDMRHYYPNLQSNSVMSFYWFGKTRWM